VFDGPRTSKKKKKNILIMGIVNAIVIKFDAIAFLSFLYDFSLEKPIIR